MATTYQTKGLEYGMTEDDLFKGFATQGFSAIMNIWEQSQLIEGEVTGQAIADAFAATDGSHADIRRPAAELCRRAGAVHRGLQLGDRHGPVECR